MSTEETDNRSVANLEDTGALVSVRISTGNKGVTLSSIPKWQRAVELGDLGPDTLVEVERSSGREAAQQARLVPELAGIFETHGFKLDLEPIEAVVEIAGEAPNSIAAVARVELTTAKLALEPNSHQNTPSHILPTSQVSDSSKAPPERLDTWENILAIGTLDPVPMRPDQRKWTGGDQPIRAKALRRDARRSLAISIAAFSTLWWIGTADHPMFPPLVLGLVTYLLWPKRKKVDLQTLRAQLGSAKADWESLLDLWNSTASSDAFDCMLSQTLEAHEALEAMQSRRADAILALNRPSLQVREHLAKFPVDHTRISGIGRARAMTLRASGFRTAADISRSVERLPGFGPSTSVNLQAWKAICEQSFVYNPRRSEDQAEVKRIDDGLSAERERLSKPMYGAALRLYEARRSIAEARSSLSPKLEAAWDRYNHLKLQLRAL